VQSATNQRYIHTSSVVIRSVHTAHLVLHLSSAKVLSEAPDPAKSAVLID